MTVSILVDGRCGCPSVTIFSLYYYGVLCFFFLALHGDLAQAQESVDWSCDLANDPCPQTLQNNRICQSEFGIDLDICRGGDCADCDQCGIYDLDCTECLNHGCHWCATSGLCTNSDLYEFNNVIGCDSPSDYSRESCNPPGSIFSDPLYTTQSWMFDQIRVHDVWQQGLSGRGVRVRINDDAIEPTHPEFAERFDAAASCDRYLPEKRSDFHGTAVASIVGGSADNNFCIVGVAPEVTLSGCHALTTPADVLAAKLDDMDISVNSYGIDACYAERRQRGRRRTQPQDCPFTYFDFAGFNPCQTCGDFSSLSNACQFAIANHCDLNYENDVVGCAEYLDLFIEGGRCEFNTLTEGDQKALALGIANGRNSKGIIYVWAAGNTYDAGEDTNFQGYINTRLTIAVGATGRDERHSSFSTAGAALFVSAPGGDVGDPVKVLAAGLDGTCSAVGIGTSFACPVVAGVIALMLEANPNLGWRDVQGILATTSRMVQDDPLDTSLVRNGAGIQHSNFYGFGIVDASAAVEAAKSWDLFGPEEMKTFESGLLNVVLADNAASPTLSTISVPSPPSGVFVVESVVVYLDVQHYSTGDLAVVLESPAGTQSILSPGNRPATTQFEQWKLLTVRSWGETAAGDWKLSVADISEGDVEGTCVDSPWSGRFEDEEGEFYLDCATGAQRFWCVDGEVSSDAEQEYIEKVDSNNGQTPVEACCECGGGLEPDSFVDQLVQWRVVLYGRSMLVAPTSVPSAEPTPIPMPTLDAGVPSPSSGGSVGKHGGFIPGVLFLCVVGSTLFTTIFWKM